MKQQKETAKNIVFHVGYPKAASTTLQKNLFSAHTDVTNLGVYPTSNIGKDSKFSKAINAPILSDLRISKLHDYIACQDGIIFDKVETKQLWKSILFDYEEGKPASIFSNERFLSARFSNSEVVEKARRLYEVCPEAKILIVIRKQVDMLKSLYRDHPFDPRTLEFQPRPVSFSRWLEIDMQRPHASLSNTLLFNRMVEIYEGFFSKEQVLVLPIELLKLEYENFLNQLSQFAGINADETLQLMKEKPENKGISSLGNRYRRWRNRLLPYIGILKPTKSVLQTIDIHLFQAVKSIGKTEEIAASDSDINIIRDKFSHENTILSERRGLSLAELGYMTLGSRE